MNVSCSCAVFCALAAMKRSIRPRLAMARALEALGVPFSPALAAKWQPVACPRCGRVAKARLVRPSPGAFRCDTCGLAGSPRRVLLAATHG